MANVPDFDGLRDRARKARRQAEDAATAELLEWHEAKLADLQADTSLSPIGRIEAERALSVEFNRRTTAAIAKAKRDNSMPRVFERELRAEG
ncbi:hypothetical protein [Agromyces bauzanensis]